MARQLDPSQRASVSSLAPYDQLAHKVSSPLQMQSPLRSHDTSKLPAVPYAPMWRDVARKRPVDNSNCAHGALLTRLRAGLLLG
jgi:hypothetical protein